MKTKAWSKGLLPDYAPSWFDLWAVSLGLV